MSLFLGFELGSTRIKAVAADGAGTQLASGAYDWENRLEDGVWTYGLGDAWKGLRESFSELKDDYMQRNGKPMPQVNGIGISAMMHGYLVFDKEGNQLTGFRTWRNTMTENSAKRLTETFGFNIPQRWSIAHLHNAMEWRESHVKDIAYMTTLGGYIHYKLTGKKVVGIGEASGIFPIDSAVNDYHKGMLRQFEEIAKGFDVPWTLREILPKVLTAGENAGHLTAEGAALLDPSGSILNEGTPLCPPEGDAGTGMVATNAVTPHTGNVSAGTSIFAMLVLDKLPQKTHPQIDMMVTPTGKPVAVVHGNNCTADLDAWVGLIYDAMKIAGAGKELAKADVYGTLYNAALRGDEDCGGLVSVNYLSGEHMTGFDEGRPLFLRNPESSFTVENFMRSLLFTAMTTLRIGMDILTKDETVTVSKMLGHGGLFKTPGVAQKLMAGALDIPVAVMETAGEGGAWGIALLAAYSVEGEKGETLEKFLEKKIFANSPLSIIEPDPTDVRGFESYMQLFGKALEVERAAVEET